jgi:hypothetical protein
VSSDLLDFSSDVRSSEEHSAQDTPRLKQNDGEKLRGFSQPSRRKVLLFSFKGRVNCAEKRGVEHKFFRFVIFRRIVLKCYSNNTLKICKTSRKLDSVVMNFGTNSKEVGSGEISAFFGSDKKKSLEMPNSGPVGSHPLARCHPSFRPGNQHGKTSGTQQEGQPADRHN